MRKYLQLVSLAAATIAPLWLGGCKPDYPECKKDKHCKTEDGEKCVDGMCQNCTTDEDCQGKGPDGANWVCHEFRCSDPAVVGEAGGLGTPCTQTTDCSGGLVCKQGLCSQCAEDFECEPGTCDLSTGLCSSSEDGGGSCQTDDDCSMDEICDNGTCVFSGVEPGPGGSPCDLTAVYFGFDSPKLDGEMADKLKQAADCISQQNRLVYLEAHADPRGSEEYNIMLTDKRGQSVKKFLSDLGVAAENMQVISKGSLEATGTDEASWANDRRVEFIWP